MMKNATPTRVLVLGSSGRIGTMLRGCWAVQSDPATEFTFQTRRADENHPADFLWDVADAPPQVLIDAPTFDCMIVLSGVVPRPDADFTLNAAIGTASITAAARLGIGTVLLASTSAVYGTHSDAPFHEEDTPHPLNDYGRSKLEMEATSRDCAQALGIKLCCLRIGNVAGADVLLLNGAALGPSGKLSLDCFTDGGTPVRSYIGPQTLAEVLISLIRARDDLPAVLNVAAPRPVSMLALTQAAEFPVTLTPAQTDRHQHVTLDCSALSALHRFGPSASTPAGIVRQWQRIKPAA